MCTPYTSGDGCGRAAANIYKLQCFDFGTIQPKGSHRTILIQLSFTYSKFQGLPTCLDAVKSKPLWR